MSQPFYQPARQSFGFSQSMQQPQGGFGGFGGGQMPQQNWGGGQGFSGFGGGQGFNFGGGQAFGGFQQQQFNPFQGGFGGGFGGGFSPFQGGFGGFNPMFGGIGGLGFNPMMGPQFGMPMQQFGFGGFNPYQHQMLQNQQFMEQRDQALGPMQQAAQQARQQNPAYAQLQQLQGQFRDQNPSYEQLKQIHDLQSQIDSDPAFIKAKNAYESAAQQFQNQQRQPMYGGIGGLGFNPMMGPQFGMPMQGFNPMMGQQFSSDHMGDMMSRGGPEMSRLSELQRGLARQQEYSPIMGLQFGMPMGQRAQLLQDQRQFGYGQDVPQTQPKEDLSFEAFKASQSKSDPNDITQYMTMQRPSQEQQYRSWLNSKITPNTNRQLMPGESPRQSISQADIDSVYNRYLENSRPNTQMSAQLAAAQAAQMRAVMGI